MLRPYLKAAHKLPKYYEKCQLESGELVLRGILYGKHDLHKLPEELSSYNISTKCDKDNSMICFFGSMNPLSNFYPAPFNYNGLNFHSSEQLIQYIKVDYFKDEIISSHILKTDTPLECKQLTMEIQNYEWESWNEVAKDLCSGGILAKFDQNLSLQNLLLNTGTAMIAECSYDSVWGTGVPLHEDRCIDKKHWVSQGILGEILEDVQNQWSERDRLLDSSQENIDLAAVAVNTTIASHTDTAMEVNPSN